MCREIHGITLEICRGEKVKKRRRDEKLKAVSDGRRVQPRSRRAQIKN
jgi:hypothetical protein